MNFYQSGLSAGMDPSYFDPTELALGTEVELEHTGDRWLARKIAMDHLVEDPQYYSKLKLMEEGHLDHLVFPLGAYRENSTSGVIWTLLATAAGAASAYHGYRRNKASNPLAWALWWAFWGFAVPIITVPVSLAQGFAEPA